MKRLLSVLCSCCVGLLTLLVLDSTAAFAGGKNGAGGGAGKTCLCHLPPGNPSNGQTICVGTPAVKAHLGHGDYLGECHADNVCGGDSGVTCPTGKFCKKEEGFCSPSAEGTCVTEQQLCPQVLDPVCGCDSMTYDNACLADVAGVTVLHTGECVCPSGETACGGTSGATCATGQFCKTPGGTCSADAEGICTPIPGSCPVDFIPVCGCDGVTYSNACFADSAGVPILDGGACVPGAACGGEGGATCPTGDFCKPPAGVCTMGAPGHCTTPPPVCSKLHDPVCGCDGVTYDNACKADVAGVAVNHDGPCDCCQQTTCGGAAGTICPSGSVCHKPQGACAPDAEGVCMPAPATCPSNIDPVCGCNGTTYSNACVADASGTPIKNAGACAP